jgi:hypothetical protein
LFLNQLTKANKNNIIEYYVYDYQGNRARTVVESDHQAQSKRDYLPSLDISINGELVVGLGVAFSSFAEDVSANVQGGTLLFCLVN